jgi:hypothetical protein
LETSADKDKIKATIGKQLIRYFASMDHTDSPHKQSITHSVLVAG